MKPSYSMVALAVLMTACTGEPHASAQELTGDEPEVQDGNAVTTVASGPMTLTSCTSDYYEISISRDSSLVFSTDVDIEALEDLGALWQSYLTMNWDAQAGELSKEEATFIEKQSIEDRHLILKELLAQPTQTSFMFFMVIGSAIGEMPNISDTEIGGDVVISDAPTAECIMRRSNGPKYEI
ncbi:MAG: hypothetical protein CMH32_05650 [Micavibrio sp.]|nr:hypothetical protein [Micavibrio sp.]HCK32773.1 hypothetical protein [Rhodospirillaceae bacterium]